MRCRLEFLGSRPIHVYKATRFLHRQSEERKERVRVTESVERIACYSVVICCGF